jgi:hypothetical protein
MLSMCLSVVGSSVYFSLRCVTVSVFMLGGLDFLEDENLRFLGVMVVCFGLTMPVIIWTRKLREFGYISLVCFVVIVGCLGTISWCVLEKIGLDRGQSEIGDWVRDNESFSTKLMENSFGKELTFENLSNFFGSIC